MDYYYSPLFKQATSYYMAVLIIACTLAVVGCLMPQVSDASDSKSKLRIDGRLSWLAEDGTAITTIDIEIAETRSRRARG